MADLKYIGKNILNHDLILKKGDVSGSLASTGSFGQVIVGGNLNVTDVSSSLSSRVTDLKTDSGSFSTRVTDLKSDSGSFSTRVTNLKSDSGSFSTRVTKNEGTGSKILAGQLEFLNITASNNTRIDGNLTVAGNYTVSGDTTFVSSSTLIIGDNIIEVNAVNPVRYGGIYVKDVDNEQTGSLIWDSTNDYWVAGQSGSEFRIPLQNSTSNLTDNRIVIAQSNGRIESGNITDDGTSVTIPLPITASSHISSSGNIFGTNLVADSASVSTRLTTEESNIDDLQTDSGSFSTRVTDLKSDSGSFSTRVTANSSSFATRITNFSTGNVELISGSATSTGSFGRVELGQSNSAPMAVYGVESTAGIRLENYKGYLEIDPHTSTVNITTDKNEVQFQNRIGARYGITGYSTGDLVFFTNSGNTTHATFSHTNGTSFTQNITGSGNLEIAGNISGSSTSTGSFGRLKVDSRAIIGEAYIGQWEAAANYAIFANSELDQTAAGNYSILAQNNGKTLINAATSKEISFRINNSERAVISNTLFSTTTDIKSSGDILSDGANAKISGSSTSTGSFGRLDIVDNVSATSFTGIFQGALSGSAQIASNISGAFAVASASFAANILNNSSSLSTRITKNEISASVNAASSASFSTRVTRNEGTGSKLLNGQLEFTNITGSGHISMSLSSTGSFGRVSATTIGGHSPLIVDSNTTFINSITSSAHVSSSMTSTASFGRVNVIALGGHQSLTIDPITTFTNVITASNKVQFDDKIFIETGSIEGDLHIRTNENLMRFGKSTNQLVVSASISASRFATGSDGSIIDLGFTAVDEEGNVVLTGEGDGIHVDSNNYWYNNKFYRVGNGRNDFLVYDDKTIKYSGEVVAQTGSFAGEMYINSPTGSMFIGKFTGGIPNSGSDNTSRFATGSDGSIIDLGFTTTDEDGNVILTTTGDGLHVDEDNYWYTSGHFKLGDGSKKIEWNTNNLNISASTVNVTTLKANDVNFSALPTSDPLTTGSLWISGSSSSGSYKSGFVMISGIHG